MKPERVWNLIDSRLKPLPIESVARRDAQGRILARPLEATVDVPPTDVSAMDGYALARPVDGDSSLDVWPVVGTLAAGDPPGFDLPPESAVRIMTGAAVPAGADRVVPVEFTDGGEERVAIRQLPQEGAHIRRQAEVLKRGESLLEEGALLTAGALALLATHGHDRVPVHRRPTVAVLTTGDEIVPPEVEPTAGQLRDSHTDFLLAAGRTLGLEFHPLGIAPDAPQQLERMTRRGLASDLLLLGGGVSMGAFDFVEDVLERLGCEIFIRSVAIQPGKPLVVAEHPGGLVFGLPGNPASVMACFWLFVRPTLRRLQGMEDGFWVGTLQGRLTAATPAAGDRDRFLPAEVELGRATPWVRPLRPVGSHDLSASARGLALLRVRAGAAAAGPGDPCEFLPLVDWPAGVKGSPAG